MKEHIGARVGARVRLERRRRAMTLSDLAARAGVGKGTLSEIETGSRNPTLATLYALAEPLGVPLADLLDHTVGAEVASDGVRARLLESRPGDEGTVEVYLLRLDAGADRRSPAHGAVVTEHLLVVRGRVEAGPAGEERAAGAGQSVVWTSNGRHTYRALDDRPAEAVLVIRSGATTV